MNRDYVVEFLRSEIGQIQMLRHVSGSTGQTELLIGHTRTLRVPLPDEQTQNGIVEAMNVARKKAEGLNAQAATLSERGVVGLAKARRVMLEKLSQSKRRTTAMPRPDQIPTIRVKPHSYQPSKAELEAPINHNATPDQIARAAVTPVRIIEDPDA